MTLANIPSPSDGVWNLGPLPLRAYALAIILGIVVAIWVGERRFVARGGRPGTVSDVAVWAIPFGLVGARAYHVATNPEFYFGDGKDPVQALYVWEGGLGIWGAIAFGALGAYLGCRVSGVRFTSYIDAVAPGVVLAQAIGRWGNYFNQELFGKPTDRPWGLEIDVDNRPEDYLEYSTFQPTFLYESLWCIGVAIVVVLADRRWKLGRGRVFALYVALYTAGRAWIEDLRIDDAHEFGSLRLNVWVAIGVFVLAAAYFVVVGRRWPGREESVLRAGAEPDEADEAVEAVEAKSDADRSADSEGTTASDEDSGSKDEEADKPAEPADADEGGRETADDETADDETADDETADDEKVEAKDAGAPVADDADVADADADTDATDSAEKAEENDTSTADGSDVADADAEADADADKTEPAEKSTSNVRRWRRRS